MFLKVYRDDIIEGLAKSAQIIPSKTGAAFLRTIWLRAENDALRIMSTDSNLEFVGEYKAQVTEDGLAGVQGRSFYDLVKKLPPGEITIKSDPEGQNILIQQAKRTYKLPTNDPTWFQAFSNYPEGDTVYWAGDYVRDLIDRISFCISDEDTMEAIACMFMVPKVQADGTKRIETAGLNGHQFAMFSFLNDDLAEMLPESGVLIQKKYLNELKKWLTDSEVELAISEKRLFFRSGDQTETFSLPLSYYQYPDYNTFLNKVQGDGASTMSAPREDMIEALDRIMIFNSENNRCTNMSFAAGEATLYSQGQELGTATESLEVEFSGELDKIAFPTRALIDIMGHLASEQVGFTFTGPEGPCGITGPEDPDYTVVIMPMKIVEETYYEEENV
jgi:DNA polymerase-3 subunit beta